MKRSTAQFAMYSKNRVVSQSFEEACSVINCWRLDKHHHRIHRSFNYQTPVAYAAACILPALATPQPPKNNAALPTPIHSLNLVQRPVVSQYP
ncbi:MAG: hypothetical protein ACR2OA_00195 [Rubripirellula sp.]